MLLLLFLLNIRYYIYSIMVYSTKLIFSLKTAAGFSCNISTFKSLKRVLLIYKCCFYIFSYLPFHIYCCNNNNNKDNKESIRLSNTHGQSERSHHVWLIYLCDHWVWKLSPPTGSRLRQWRAADSRWAQPLEMCREPQTATGPVSPPRPQTNKCFHWDFFQYKLNVLIAFVNAYKRPDRTWSKCIKINSNKHTFMGFSYQGYISLEIGL